MRRKRNWNRLMSMLMAGLMLAQTPASALAAEVTEGTVSEAEILPEDGEATEEETDATSGDENFQNGEVSIENIETIDPEAYGLEQDIEPEMALANDTQTPEEAAAAYLKTKYIDGRITTTGGANVVKSEDGLSYEVGLKSPSGYAITSINFAKPLSSDNYKSGWYMESEFINPGTKKPAKIGSVSLIRPTAEQGDQSFVATLKLFAKDTEDSAINDGTATPLATQDFTVTIKAAEPQYYMTVVVKDEKGNSVTDATVTLEKDWSSVKAESDGSYEMENGATYTLTVKKDGYNDYKESYFTFTGDKSQPRTEKTVTLTQIVMRTIRFEVKDKATGAAITNPTITVKQGYYTTVKPESDGSYKLKDGTSYNYTVTATGYKTASDSITPAKDDKVTVELEKNITAYTVKFQAMDGETAIAGAAYKVEREDEDDWGDTEWVTETPSADGSYALKKTETYRYTIQAEGYEDAVATYTPSGNEENITVSVPMSKSAAAVDPKDQATVDEAVKVFDDELGALYAQYGTNDTVMDLVKAKLKNPDGKYAAIANIADVAISVKSTDLADVIGTDGVIHYITSDTLNSNKINFKTVSVELQFELNGAKAATAKRRVIVCWDQKYFKTKMQAEADALVWDKIKGNNTEQNEVTEDLTLPGCNGSDLRQVWSVVTWTSSDTSIIEIKKPSIDSPIYPSTGTVTRPVKDTEVTLTATFSANETVLNEMVEKAADFGTITKEFKVLVKAQPQVIPTEDELLAILDKYYTAESIKDINTGATANLANCEDDLQLPRYTRIKDDQDEYVFENKEITVTTDNPAITVSGYRANVDRFSEKGFTGNLIVTFTRKGVTVTKKIPVTVAGITDELLDAELAMMEQAKLHYFDGLNDGRYTDKDSVTGNLHAFQEMVLDENQQPVWIYTRDAVKGTGIIPDDCQDDPWIMEGSGYNKFKSSNTQIVAHENLVVVRPETDTQVTITSWLSSERYGKLAKDHPENAKLQKLFHQEVSATITVSGTKASTDGLQALVKEAQDLADNMKEGTTSGTYKEGTKAALLEAIAQAQDVLDNENATESEVRAAILQLQAALDTAENAKNVTTAAVTVRMNDENGTPAVARKITVKSDDAAAYGYVKPAAMKYEVTAADALYAAHAAMYGDAFAKDPSGYLVIDGQGMISTLFGKETVYLGYAVNNKWVATGTNATVLVDGDTFSVFFYNDKSCTDRYFYFDDIPSQPQAGAAFTVKVRSYGYDEKWNTVDQTEKGTTVALKNTETGEVIEAITDENGMAALTAPTAGTYQLYISKTPYEYFIVPAETLEVQKGAEPTPEPKPEPEPTPAPTPETEPAPTPETEPAPTPEPSPTPAPQPTPSTDNQVKRDTSVIYLLAKGKSGNKQITISWNKVKGATSYKIYGGKCTASAKLLKTVSGSTTSWTHKKLKKGTHYKYYVAAYDKNGRIVKSTSIHVATKGSSVGAVKKITVNKTSVKLKVNKTTKLKARAVGNGKKLRNHVAAVRYLSTNTRIATVTGKGVIKAKKKGTCYIYCYAPNGVQKKVKVTVK